MPKNGDKNKLLITVLKFSAIVLSIPKLEKIAENNVDRTEEKIEFLEEKTEAFVDGGDSNKSEPIAKTITEPVSEYIESINARRYGTAVEVDPLKII